jgi:hypothetical protein
MTGEYKQHQSFPLSLPSSILERATDLASREGLSLNHFIGLAVAEKISRLDQGEVWTTTKQLSHLVSSVADPKNPQMLAISPKKPPVSDAETDEPAVLKPTEHA